MKTLIGISLCLGLLASGTANAAPVQWAVSVGGNGHWYEAVPVSGHISWTDSKVAAENTGAYLATITSQAENNFVFSLVKDRPEFWESIGPYVAGPWLGGYQDRNDPYYAEPSGGWKWVSGETWSYTSWMQGNPSGSTQDYLHFCGYGSILPTWDDMEDVSAEGNHGYIVELEPVPEPSSFLALLSGLGGIGLVWRRK